MLCLLRERERPVSELVACFNISQPSVSEHLGILRRVGLVESRKVGRQQIYSYKSIGMAVVGDWLSSLDSPNLQQAPPDPVADDGGKPPIRRSLSMEID